MNFMETALKTKIYEKSIFLTMIHKQQKDCDPREKKQMRWPFDYTSFLEDKAPGCGREEKSKQSDLRR